MFTIRGRAKKIKKGNGADKYHIVCQNNEYCVRKNLPFFSSSDKSYQREYVVNHLQKSILCPGLIQTQRDYKDNDVNAVINDPFYMFHSDLIELYEWIPSNPISNTQKHEDSLIDFYRDYLNAIASIPIKNNEIYEEDMRSGFLQTDISPDLLELIYNEKLLKQTGLSRTTLENIIKDLSINETSILQAKREVGQQPVKYVHGDLNSSNVGVINDKVKVLYDLESLRQGHIVEDVAWALSDYCNLSSESEFDIERSDKFFSSILNGVPDLNEEDWKLMWSILFERTVRSIYLHLSAISSQEISPSIVLARHISRAKNLSRFQSHFMTI